MGTRPYVSFDEVKARVPIPDVLQVLGIADRFEQRNGALVGACPFPSHVHGPSPNGEQFRINLVEGSLWMWRCWGDCKASGNVVQFVMRFLGLSAEHVRFWFAEHFGERLNLGRSRREGQTPQAPPAETKVAGEVLQEPQPADRKTTDTKLPDEASEYKPIRFRLNVDHDVPYLTERGITVETTTRYGIGLVRKGMMAGYVAVPVWEFPKQKFPFGYLGRWPGNDFDASQGRPRYKLPANFPKQRCLFGINEALEGTEGKPLVVVEGVFGALFCVQHGFPATVSTLGSSLGDEQADLLIGTGRPLVLFFDGDESGRAGMEAGVAKLSASAFVRSVRLNDGQQPDDLAPNELESVLSFAK
jgi:DNA primase